MFEKIMKWYSMKLWNKSMVINAHDKGVITEDEMTLIIGGEVDGTVEAD